MSGSWFVRVFWSAVFVVMAFGNVLDGMQGNDSAWGRAVGSGIVGSLFLLSALMYTPPEKKHEEPKDEDDADENGSEEDHT